MISRRKNRFFIRYLQRLADFCFPAYCLHCQERVEASLLLCTCCVDVLEMCELQESCQRAYCMQKLGPALSLVSAANGSLQEEIMKTIAAWMILRSQTLGWEHPDYIMAFSQDRALARRLALWMNVPLWKADRYYFWKKKKEHKNKLSIWVVALQEREEIVPQELSVHNVYELSFLQNTR